MRREKTMTYACITAALGLLAMVAGVILVVYNVRRKDFDRGFVIVASGVIALAGLTVVFITVFPPIQSNTTKVVTVYDVTGKPIEKYEGNFKIDANPNRIIFDVPQPDGSYRRVQIWESALTVTIVEK